MPWVLVKKDGKIKIDPKKGHFAEVGNSFIFKGPVSRKTKDGTWSKPKIGTSFVGAPLVKKFGKNNMALSAYNLLGEKHFQTKQGGVRKAKGTVTVGRQAYRWETEKPLGITTRRVKIVLAKNGCVASAPLVKKLANIESLDEIVKAMKKHAIAEHGNPTAWRANGSKLYIKHFNAVIGGKALKKKGSDPLIRASVAEVERRPVLEYDDPLAPKKTKKPRQTKITDYFPKKTKTKYYDAEDELGFGASYSKDIYYDAEDGSSDVDVIFEDAVEDDAPVKKDKGKERVEDDDDYDDVGTPEYPGAKVKR